MSRLWGYVRRYRLRYAIGGVCLVITATLAMVIPYLLKQAVDAIAAKEGIEAVGNFSMAIIVIAIVQGIARTYSRSLIFNVGRDIEFDLRNDLFAHLEKLGPAFYQSQRTGDLMSRVINDVNAVRMMLGPGILNLVNTPLYYVYGVGIMITLDVPLTLAALVPFPLLLLVVKKFSRRIMEHTLRVQDGLAKMSSRVQENLSGLHVVRAYAIEDQEARSFAELNATFKDESLGLAKVRAQLVPFMRTAASLGTLVVLWFGGVRVIEGHLTIGDLVAFLGYLGLLAWPTMALGWMLSTLQRGRAALLRLELIFATEPEIAEGGALDAATVRSGGDVVFDDVSFAYPSDPQKPVLTNVSFSIAPGQKLAVVGRTGSGKSTIAHLLSRSFDVTAGAIRLDGNDIRDLPLAYLRGSIGVVSQDPFLFSTTVADNIRFAVDGASEAEISAAAEAAGIDGDIASFPKGYQTQVGERGVTLSGGQKQRLTLARAILARSPILVLDDALSSVDARTEERILRHLDSAIDGRTSVVITHRISTIRDADQIIVLDDGQVIESGNHESLLADDGVYADLYRRQQLEEEIETL